MPFAVLHGYYARGEKYFSRNCTRNVPEFIDTFEYSERNEIARARYGKLILKTWEQKKTIDSGTNPPEVEKIIDLIKDYALGYKLPGAGGGGYLYIVAKDPEAAVRIRRILTENPPNEKARFVEMTLSDKGFQVSRS